MELTASRCGVVITAAAGPSGPAAAKDAAEFFRRQSIAALVLSVYPT